MRGLRNRTGLSLRQVGQSVGLSAGYLSKIEREKVPPPDRRKVLELAHVIGASPVETDHLLELAGYPPETIADIPGIDLEDSGVRRLLRILSQVRNKSGHHAVDFVETAISLILQGALQADEIPGVGNNDKTVATLSADEEALDQTLTSLFEGHHEKITTIQRLFETRKPSWELRRRIAEGLPRLAKQYEGDQVLEWARLLRHDHDPEYKVDIRRRVVEAIPTLHEVYPEAAQELLKPLADDDIFVHLAIVESAHDLGMLDDVEPYFQDPLVDHADVLAFLIALLKQSPSQAIETIRQARDRELLFRVVCVRALRRILLDVPEEALKELLYVLRRRAGETTEHNYVRRATAMSVPALTQLLDTKHKTPALFVLQRLAEEDDVFIRRAVADKLSAIGDPNIVRTLADDPDPYIRRRARSRTEPQGAT